MLTPYDWQEGIGHRAQYVENKLEQGSPVLALSIKEGILLVTYRRNARKIFEIYDRLAFAAVGQQSDIESLRVAAVDFAHQEGFNRSEQDVTIQRVVTALSGPVKKAFGDFSTSPFVVRALFAEVSSNAETDTYMVLDFDGDFSTRKRYAFVATTPIAAQEIETKLSELAGDKLDLKKAEKELKEIWSGLQPERGEGDDRGEVILESALLERSESRENRFRVLDES